MNHSLSLVLIVGLSSLCLARSAAASPSTLQLATTISFSLALPDGHGLPPLLIPSIFGTLPIGGRWNLMLRGGFATPLDHFQLEPQAQVGVVYELTSSTRIGATMFYRYVHNWDNPRAPDGHVVGIGLAPIFPRGGTMAVGFPVGVTYNGTSNAWSISCAVEFAFKLLP